MTNTVTPIGIAPCPDWCTDHRGMQSTGRRPLEDAASLAEIAPTGSHRTQLHWHKRFDDWEVPDAVVVEQAVSPAGEWGASIHVWRASRRNFQEPDGPPVRHMSTMTAIEARALGEALIRAADLMAEIHPDRCECGEPVEADEPACTRCRIRQNEARRTRLVAVEMAED